jgi:hypothetical protein
MSGITTGARQFNWMLPLCDLKWDVQTEVITVNNGWEATKLGGNSYVMHQTEKLDLRALLDGSPKGLDILNVSVQESLPWTLHKNAPNTPLVTDVISTVKPDHEMIMAWPVLPPGFRAGEEHGLLNTLNPAQVIWGLWRYFVTDQNTPNDKFALATQSSCSFGDGEIAVSPHLYYTRIITYEGGFDQVIPAVNIVCAAQVVSMNDGQEFTQMIRAGQR